MFENFYDSNSNLSESINKQLALASLKENKLCCVATTRTHHKHIWTARGTVSAITRQLVWR